MQHFVHIKMARINIQVVQLLQSLYTDYVFQLELQAICS